MPALNVRNLSEETHKALRIRAAQHGRSTEAEVRAIIEAAVRQPDSIRLGSVLAAIGDEFGGIELSIERDFSSAEPASFD